MASTRQGLTRRQFIRERLVPGIKNPTNTFLEPPKVVSSLILQIRPEFLESVCSTVAKLPYAEVHGDDGKSKAVVVLETDSDAELSEFMSMAAEFPGVINVCMVFHHSDASSNLFPAE